MQNSNPTNVDISKSSGVTIEWSDGHRSHYELQYLRDHCPCAMCGKTEEGHTRLAGDKASPFQMYKPRACIQEVEQVGHYALRFFWNDGHSTGIYSYEYLRSICPCPDCHPAEPTTLQ
jgi:DUF971 family protein